MMTQDGSQYDITPVWDRDRMLCELESVLTAIDAARTDAERVWLRQRANGLNLDLKKLHNIDLGPF